MDNRIPIVFPPIDGVAHDDTSLPIELVGDRSLLTTPSLGVLCSSRLPGAIVLKTYDFMHRMKLRPVTLTGGFHSPMERTCLDILLKGITRVILVPARGLGRMRVPTGWRSALDEGRMAVISPFDAELRRTTRHVAEERNRLVIRLARELFVPFASRGGMTERLTFEALDAGKPVYTFSLEETAALRERGATSIEGLDENSYLLKRENPPRRST